MTEAQFFATPGYGDTMLAELHYNQAVRIGDRVEISGQGGWDDEITFPADLGDEIVRAFDNVERTLALAGATWDDVVSLDSFHIPTENHSIGHAHNSVMVDQMRRRFGQRAPIWTQLGVAALGAPGMRIEIRVSAVLGSNS